MEQTERPNGRPVANHGTNYYSIITKRENAHSLGIGKAMYDSIEPIMPAMSIK